jgi:uncharacterized protein YidB (DUF937 family)
MEPDILFRRSVAGPAAPSSLNFFAGDRLLLVGGGRVPMLELRRIRSVECRRGIVSRFLAQEEDMASSRMLALLGLLAVAGYQNRDKLGELLGGITGAGNNTSPTPPAGGASQGAGGGLLENILGGVFGGSAAGTGDVRGGLGDLLEQFNGRGQGEIAKSWVERGPNRDVATDELEGALGEDTIDALTRQTGLSRDELLGRLRAVLPTAVDGLTPEGRLPTEIEVSRWAGR